MIAGAGAAYLNGGLLGWEFVFCAVMTCLAYLGLKNYRFIGAAWVLHTVWDVVHHLYGTPIVPFVPLSSAGCAICDLALALWYFQGARSTLPSGQAARQFPPRPKRVSPDEIYFEDELI